ncbi:Possible protease sohB [hydrothermal vent metagenome]|uniref:Possible protease sohB n=1 Tax=hydrothermal vent metagenome TaxID=652676 RepID=A0A3B0ZXP2_9ZZZZ
MQNFISEYSLFLAETITIIVGIACILILIALLLKNKDGALQLEISKINERYDTYTETLNTHILNKDELKKYAKEQKKKIKSTKKKTDKDPQRNRMFVLNFDGDIKASDTPSLTEEITAILTIAKPTDEILLRLYSAGGLVHAYGLAASQLQRITKNNIPLTIAVDKVAASGGYMMACVADRIIAAPFSIIGSIGVVAQIPNFHRVLKKHDIDFELITAGKYKRTMTIFGENTDEARKKFSEEINETHQLFQNFISENRAQVDIERVSTGEHWHGVQAIELNLVDELLTSDDYMLAASKEKDIYEIKYCAKKSLSEKLSFLASDTIGRINNKFTQSVKESELL